MPAPLTIIEEAFEELGVKGAARPTLSAENLSIGLSRYNLMIGRWATRRRYVTYIRNQAFTFSTSSQSYTFGPSGNFTPSSPVILTRPTRIERAKLVLVSGSPDSEYEITVINTDHYADISTPALPSSLPSKVYYEPTLPNGTLYPHPYPTDTSNQIRLYWWHRLGAIAIGDIATSIDLSDGQELAMVMDLAKLLCGPTGKTFTDDQKELHRQAMADFQSINPTSEPPVTTQPGGYGMSSFLSRNF